VYTEPGVGTTMRIYLPVSEGGAAECIRADDVAPAEGRITGAVVIVEDDDAVRAIAVRTLERIGCTVHAASNGPEALRLMGTPGFHFDLLFTDVVMPELSGPELVARVRQRFPGMKVLFTTGYTADMVVWHELLDEETDVLTKPYTHLDLAQRVRGALDLSGSPRGQGARSDP